MDLRVTMPSRSASRFRSATSDLHALALPLVLFVGCLIAPAVARQGMGLLIRAFALAVAGYAGVRWLIMHRRIRRASLRIEAFAAIEGAGRHGLDRLERDVTQAESLVKGVDQRLVQRHPTTNLPTREPLFARIAQDIASGAGGGLLGVVGFPDFERLYAFDAGLAEATLSVLAERITRMLGSRHCVAQIDRSRFAVWYAVGSDPDRARDGLRALGYALGGIIPYADREIVPEIHIGAARHPQDGTTPPDLLARAIASLIAVGADGERSGDDRGNAIGDAQERYALEQDLRRAVDRAEFELYFQPLVDAVAGQVCGAEALLRWHHPVQGMIAPSRFVPIMEAAGLADEIGLWTLNAACREARTWQRQQLGGLRVAVNISAHQLARPDMRASVERTLARHSLRPAALELELTETVATGDAERTTLLFQELRAIGIAIAIDDFGTGYSSFSVLRTLSFDKIKIDREFVTSVDSRTDSQAICQSIIALGRGLGIRVLAEGVERQEEYAWLRAAGCTHFQGYYFARPLPAADFIDFVRDVPRLRALLVLPPVNTDQDFSERLSA